MAWHVTMSRNGPPPSHVGLHLVHALVQDALGLDEGLSREVQLILVRSSAAGGTEPHRHAFLGLNKVRFKVGPSKMSRKTLKIRLPPSYISAAGPQMWPFITRYTRSPVAEGPGRKEKLGTGALVELKVSAANCFSQRRLGIYMLHVIDCRHNHELTC